MKAHIQSTLLQLEQERNIAILYAVESGSRAWGFASTNSDWDVRFFYVHRPEWYLSIDDARDNMDIMLPNALDLAGWELRKTLRLFRKSNPPLLEWLNSPLVYLEQFSTAERMRTLVSEYLSPRSCMYHYLSMAKRNFTAYLQSDTVRIKKYFYVLRPVLACRWIASNHTMAPMEFRTLLDTQVDDPQLKASIEQLLQRKQSGEELDKAPRIKPIHEFLATELERFDAYCTAMPREEPPQTEALNKLFRETLEEVWQANA